MKPTLLLRRLAYAAGAILLASCDDGETLLHPLRIAGQISFPDARGCATMTDDQIVSIEACQAFKRTFDVETGDPASSVTHSAKIVRPLSARIDVSVYRVNPSDNSRQRCSKTTTQSDDEGFFNLRIEGCGPGENILIEAETRLEYRFESEFDDLHGTTRAVWPTEDATELFPEIGTEGSELRIEPVNGSVLMGYSQPVLVFKAAIPSEPYDSSIGMGEIEFGNQVFLSDTTLDPFHYLVQVLSNYQTMVQLQARLRDHYRDSSMFYESVFRPSEIREWGPSYTLAFDHTWAGGGVAFSRYYGPNLELYSADENHDGRPDGTNKYAWLLSSTGTIGHEFGHSIHGGFSPSSFRSDYTFASKMMRPNGEVYDWGHYGGQLQEMGTSITEGLASSIGAYLLNECNGSDPWYRLSGGPSNMNRNDFTPNEDCDGSDACSQHHIRWSLRERGLTEGSDEWNRRVTALQQLSDQAAGLRSPRILSNSEARLSQWGCDLLDSDTRIIAEQVDVTGRFYIPNFTYWIGQALDGAWPGLASVAMVTYDEVQPENVQISLPQLIEALGRYCPDCAALPGDGDWGPEYNRQRLSATEGKLSPQTMSRYLSVSGIADLDELKNLLRSNLMEDQF